MKVPNTILDLIGNTPMLQVRSFDTGPCTLLLKLESQNPGGSIKDRIGRSMIEAAEREGKIGPGSTLVEATAGNTGLGLALVAASKGYRLILVIPDKMSGEKLAHLRALGASIVMTRSDVGKGHPQYYQDLAQRIAGETPGAYYINQFNNPANPLAHELTTGPEIWEQTGHKLDAMVCGVGSGGTITGLSRYFAKVAPMWRSYPGRSGGVGAGGICADEKDRHGRIVAGRRNRRGFYSRHRRSEPGFAGPTAFPMPKRSRPCGRC